MQPDGFAARRRGGGGGGRLARRAIGGLAVIRAGFAELVPSRAQRCGKSPAAGAARVLFAVAHRLRRGDRYAVVSIDRDARVRADLSGPHGRRLFAYGFCEPAAFMMRSLLQPGDVAIDGGANIGLYTLLAAAAVGPRGRVIACEPSPTTSAILRDNVALNDFGWVDVREVALAAAPGRLELHVFEPGSGYSSFAPADQTRGTHVEVEVTTLDDVAGALLDRTTVVKLDTEGAELLALRGARRLFERARPDFIIELEPEHLERQGASVGEVQALFIDADYEAFTIVEGVLEPLHGPWERPSGDPNIVIRPRERARG